MKKYIYRGQVVEMDYTGELGTTIEDAYQGKVIELNDEQIAFYEKHDFASVDEIINCKLWEYERTIEDTKYQKIREIEQYDISDNINTFCIDGFKLWLDKTMRMGLVNSINIEKQAGRENSELWINGSHFTIPCDIALGMLSQLELYALDCYTTTQRHKYNVEQLNTIDEVDAYDFTKDYPEKLNFKTK